MNKGLIFDIRRFSVHDGPGIRTTVFFKGCPLTCWWCHNPESRDIRPEQSTKHLALDGRSFEREETTGRWMSVEEVMQEILQDRIFYDESDGGVTFSGGEPMLQEGFLIKLLKECHDQGIHTTLDTSGFASIASIEKIANWVDLFLYDLKIIHDEMHIKYTGESNKSILENLKFLYTSGKNVILRFPVIPGITDTPENIRDLKEFITHLQIPTSPNPDIPTSPNPQIPTSPNPHISLLPYHAMAREKYRRFCMSNPMEGIPNLKPEALGSLKTVFESMGLTVSIGG